MARSSSALLSAIERSDSDSVPMVCATAIFSAILGVASNVTLEKVLTIGLAVLVLAVDALVGGEHADVADDRLGGLERRTVAAAGDLLGQDQVDPVAREDEAGDAGGGGHRNGDGAHARAERRGEEAAIVRADERALGERLAGGDRIADDRADQRLCGSRPARPRV